MKKITEKKSILYAVIILVVSMCFMVPVNVFSENEEKNTIIVGDLDGDKKITLDDVIIELKYALKINEFPSEEIRRIADVTDNGTVDLDDVMLLLKKALHLAQITDRPAGTSTPEIPEPTDNNGAETTTSPAVTVEPTITPPPEKTRRLKEVEAVIDNVVTGSSVECEELNGALYSEDKDTYLMENTERGIKFKNPFAGNTALHEDIESVISTDAEEGFTSVWDLDGASITGDGVDDFNKTDNRTYMFIDNEVEYTIPQWTKGVSISFWAKIPEEERQNPLLVLENENFAVSMWADGSVYFRDGVRANNMLDNTSDNILGKWGEWNHYTVTIANDWITVYVNGQENLFDCLWISRKIIGAFNDGFLTRYNFVTDLTKEMVEKDERGYYILSKAWNTETENYHDNFSAFANHRFRGANSRGKLMLDYIIDNNTNMWIGGTDTAVGEKYTNHGFKGNISVSDIKVYDRELTPEEVSANYKFDTVKPE